MSFAGFLGDVLGGAVKNDNLRDYQHASRTFRSGNYALLPKFKNQWHIAFDINPEVNFSVASARSNMQADRLTRFSSASSNAADNLAQMSVLCKNVKLPSYRFETKRFNQYNRQIIGVNKISYEPISVEFHDDSLNVIRNFWDCYYTYYIQDARYRKLTKPQGGIPIPKEWQQDSSLYSSIYTDDIAQNWGLDTVNNVELDRVAPFFRSIRIYHFSRPVDAVGTSEDNLPHYAEYTLINPILTAFEHDTLDYTTSEGTVNRMTIEYETVLYSQGVINEPLPGRTGNQIEEYDEMLGFKQVNDRYRDKAKSPLSNPTASLLGNTGLLNTATGVFTGLTDGTMSPLQAALTAGKTIATWKQSGGVKGLVNSISQEAKGVINSSLTQIQQEAQSGNQQITVPTALKTAGGTISSTFNKLRSLKPR
jgi:hypothetical protein